MSTVSERRGDEAAIPYQLPQPAFMSPDIVHFGVLDKWLEDDNDAFAWRIGVSCYGCLAIGESCYIIKRHLLAHATGRPSFSLVGVCSTAPRGRTN